MQNSKKRWSTKENQILINNRKNSYFKELVDMLKEAGYERTKKSVERRCQALGLQFDDNKDVTADTASDYFDEVASKANRVVIAKRKTIAKKIVCISDLHIPFHNDAAIQCIVEEHKGADVLVVNGDMLDMYSVSVFGKQKRIPLMKEYIIARKYLEYFSANFKEVILTEGNHEARIDKYFSKAVSQEVLPMIAQPILKRLANGEIYNAEGELTDMDRLPNVTFQKEHSWWTKVGNAIICHPSAFLGNTPNRMLGTSAKATTYFKDREDFDCLVCAHTHLLGTAINATRLTIEQGSLCQMLEYAKNNSKLSYGITALGYAVLYQDKDGNTDLGKSGHIFLDIVK